jgi:hypothetical protein
VRHRQGSNEPRWCTATEAWSYPVSVSREVRIFLTSIILDELRSSGQFGAHALEFLVQLAHEELSRFPVLRADRAWSDEDWAAEFFVAKGRALVTEVAIKADDDDAVRRMMRRWMRNWLIDQHARTAWGALRDRLEQRLVRDGRFRRAPAEHFWCLDSGPDTAGSVHLDALVAVAQRTHVTLYPQSSESRRRARLGKAGELEALLANVLVAANGSLHISTLTRVVADRFPHVLDPATIPMEGHDESVPSVEPTPDEALVKAEDAQAIEATAASIYACLSDVERRLVTRIDDPCAVSSFLGVGRSTTALRIRQLKAKLIELAGDDQAARRILFHVIRQCQASEKASWALGHFG